MSLNSLNKFIVIVIISGDVRIVGSEFIPNCSLKTAAPKVVHRKGYLSFSPFLEDIEYIYTCIYTIHTYCLHVETILKLCSYCITLYIYVCVHMWQQYVYYIIETYALTTVSIIIGWLIKEGKVRRKRYFVLTDNNQLRYYRTEDTRQPVSGNIHLNRSDITHSIQ